MANNPRHLRPPLTSTYDFLRFYARSKKSKNQNVMCLQVGANDGKINDPVYEYFTNYGWKGILVEPQTDVFEQGLTKTYEGNKNVILENVALANQEGHLPFYRVAISKARWATGLSSFDRKSLEGHIENGYIIRKAQDEGLKIPENKNDLIETVQVPTCTVDALLNKHKVSKLDVVCIDTEGYDFEILKLIDLKRLDPEVVFFESKNLSNKDFSEAKNLLQNLGYQLFWEKGDTLAIKYPYPILERAKGWFKAFSNKV
jgi:FkbM family methyltransferase